MKSSATAYGRFSASHHVKSHSLCERGDGHDWIVAVRVEDTTGSVRRTGMVVDHAELVTALGAVCSELHGKDLNEMLPGVIATPEGVAAYIHERLVLQFPTITSVRVQTWPFEAEVEWTLR